MTIAKAFISKHRKAMISYATKRRDIIKQSGDALHHSKRAIFALHRDNKKEAIKKLTQSQKIFKGLIKKYKNDPKLFDEGSYKAGLEEFVEATLFYQFLTKGIIGEVKSVAIRPELYIAGLCDVPGELYRFAIKAATDHDVDMVKKCARASDDIIGELIEFNLTSYLRNKFDQAKQANHRLEKVVYDVSLVTKKT
jgi:translin